MNTKKPWESKTIILNSIMGLCMAIAAFFPQAQVFSDFLKSNAIMIGTAWSVLSIVLRAVSKDKIQLGE